MSIILNIDTSIETASVSIAKDGFIQAYLVNPVQKEHASFLHNAVKQLLASSSLDIKQMDAIAVTNGPGSYTGLRVGLASAKGLCYALHKPLITIGTLNVLAAAAIYTSGEASTKDALFCPMLDARRMEVFTAIFDKDMNEVLPACAMILDESLFGKLLETKRLLFFGSGAMKWKNISRSQNAGFINELDITVAISKLSFEKFLMNDFTDLSYSEPLYVKEFFTP
ncbi:MAG: tRNA (adenosine(37)-N6)-threonylcarbamoyltransferase complex dimerization subunit type 1 TsaB [Ferruginibacter sp.]